MKRFVGVFVVVVGLVFAGQIASAQERGASAGREEISAFPGGGILFTESSSASDFTNYALGGSFTYNFNRFVGIEGEGGASFGVDQRLSVRNASQSVKPPNTLAYNGNAIVYPAGNNHAFVPYATGGIGGLTLFERRALGVNDTTTFLTGNVGGGVKYYFNSRWGVRGDYRFFAVRSKDDAPSFFGQETQYGHRVYGGIILNVLQ
jgi:outer membrane protein with beta-barrel domain